MAMPHMNGRELAERLAAQRPDFMVLFMSGYRDDALLRRGLMAPDVSYIQKLFSPDALARTVVRSSIPQQSSVKIKNVPILCNSLIGYPAQEGENVDGHGTKEHTCRNPDRG